MRLPFVKMHGLGNDFVMVEDLDSEIELTEDQVVRVCARHFGVGADGLILVRRDGEGRPYMHYFNSDGSLAEMCGNGIRCFAKYLVDRGIVTESPVDVGTLGGVRRIVFETDGEGRMTAATVDMGVPILTPSEIPTTFEGEGVFDRPIETEYGTVRVTALSMGNPHAIIWWEGDIADAPVDTLGPAVETHEAFPNKTNVEFARRLDAGHIAVRVWERGVGETLSCGTGACAVAVAAILTCQSGRSGTVSLPGGDLHIHWRGDDDHVLMTGPAEEVFEGGIEI